MPHLNQKGSPREAGVAHILLLLAGLGVLAFLLVSSSAEFKNNLFTRLFPKQFSQAAISDPISGPITPVFVQRIDSGATANFTDSVGNVWSADRAFSTGSYGYIGGTATTTFSGSTGIYNVIVGYFDENDGNATLQLSIGGQVVDAWSLNETTSSNSPASTNVRTRTVSTLVNITNGSSIVITGTRNAGDNASVDYINFSPR